MCATMDRFGRQACSLARNARAPFALDHISGDKDWSQLPPPCARDIACKHTVIRRKCPHNGPCFAMVADRADDGRCRNIHTPSCQDCRKRGSSIAPASSYNQIDGTTFLPKPTSPVAMIIIIDRLRDGGRYAGGLLQVLKARIADGTGCAEMHE